MNSSSLRPTTLYHATKPKSLLKYVSSGKILLPVRGFNTLRGAVYWGVKHGRDYILSFSVYDDSCLHKLPDHHNHWGTAWWYDGDVPYGATSMEPYWELLPHFGLKEGISQGEKPLFDANDVLKTREIAKPC